MRCPCQAFLRGSEINDIIPSTIFRGSFRLGPPLAELGGACKGEAGLEGVLCGGAKDEGLSSSLPRNFLILTSRSKSIQCYLWQYIAHVDAFRRLLGQEPQKSCETAGHQS